MPNRADRKHPTIKITSNNTKRITMTCIFCDNENEAKSIEHIVPESFGNKKYVMTKGAVCDVCNAKFSKFEGLALANSVFAMQRAIYGIKTKKGKNVKGKLNDLIIEGDKKFRKKYITITGLNDENFKDFDSVTQTGDLMLKPFDKTEVPTSKLVLKIGLESIYTSKHKIFKKYDFKDLKDFLTNKKNKDWPFLNTDFEFQEFKSVPIQNYKFDLKMNHCELKFLEINENTLLFNFMYGPIGMTINLLNRNLDWIKNYLIPDKVNILYPEHYRAKINKK